MELTTKEKGIIGIIRFNEKNPFRYLINKNWQIGQLKFNLKLRSKHYIWGRFGGGWNWNIGFEWCSTTLLIHWLIGTIRISWK